MFNRSLVDLSDAFRHRPSNCSSSGFRFMMYSSKLRLCNFPSLIIWWLPFRAMS